MIPRKDASLIGLTEFEILALCSRATLDEREEKRLRRLLQENGASWSAFSWLASRHGVTPLASRHLNRLGAGLVPARPLEQLRLMAQSAKVQNQTLFEELSLLLSQFERDAIPVIPLEGPVLAFCLFGNWELRESTELGVIIPRDMAEEAISTLAKAGYNPAEDSLWQGQEDGLGMDTLSNEFGSHFELSDHDLKRQVRLQVIWSPSLVVQMPKESFSGLAETVLVSERRVNWVSPEELLALLNVIGWLQSWGTLKCLSDLAQFIERHPQLDWRAALARAYELTPPPVVLTGLYLVRDVLQINLPSEVVDALDGNAQIRLFAAHARERLSESSRPSGSALLKALYLDPRDESALAKEIKQAGAFGMGRAYLPPAESGSQPGDRK